MKQMRRSRDSFCPDNTEHNQDWIKSVESVARVYGIPQEEITLQRLAEAMRKPESVLLQLEYIRRWFQRHPDRL